MCEHAVTVHRCCRQAGVKELQDQLQQQHDSALEAEKAEQVRT